MAVTHKKKYISAAVRVRSYLSVCNSFKFETRAVMLAQAEAKGWPVIRGRRRSLNHRVSLRLTDVLVTKDNELLEDINDVGSPLDYMFSERIDNIDSEHHFIKSMMKDWPDRVDVLRFLHNHRLYG